MPGGEEKNIDRCYLGKNMKRESEKGGKCERKERKREEKGKIEPGRVKINPQRQKVCVKAKYWRVARIFFGWGGVLWSV
jgi:hypothetical protein